jgi:hypothetical protein
MVRRTMSQRSNAKTADNSVIAVSRDRLQLGVILVTALEKQSERHCHRNGVRGDRPAG